MAHRSEIWSFDIDGDDQLVFTGSGEGEVKAWRIDHDALAVGLKEDETGQVCKKNPTFDQAEHLSLFS